MPAPTIIVHGGAGTIHPDVRAAYAAGTRAAAEAGQAVLDAGGPALEAVTAAVVYLENDTTFNAGTGSTLNRDGLPQCDALVALDDLSSGAVAGVSGIRNPVLLARAVMEQTPHLLLVGTGAEALSERLGVPRCDPQEMIVPRRRKRYAEMIALNLPFFGDPEQDDENMPLHDDDGIAGDTVGACAIDSTGRIAVATSTGGIMLKLPGRVGDAPLIGSGTYCGPAGAITCTGHGEAVMRVVLAKYCYDLLADGRTAEQAATAAIAHLLERVNGHAGLIVVDAQGRRAWATSTRNIAVGLPGVTREVAGGSGGA